MEIVREEMPEAEVVLRFLQAEIDKPRVQELMAALGAPRSLVVDGDLGDETEIAHRAVLLRLHRGYPDDALFRGFPSDVRWSLVRVARDELLGFLYLANEPRWAGISGGTRDPREGGRRLIAGQAEGATADEFDVRQGLSTALGSLIAVTDGTRCVLVEGHNRVTTLAMFPDACRELVEVYLGTSESLRNWYWF